MSFEFEINGLNSGACLKTAYIFRLFFAKTSVTFLWRPNTKLPSVSVHFFEKWRHFVSSKTLLCLGLGWDWRKYVFGQTCFRANLVEPKITSLTWHWHHPF